MVSLLDRILYEVQVREDAVYILVPLPL